MAKSRLNLSTILKHLDLRNLEVYEALRCDETDRKELDRMLAFLLPLWVSGTVNGADQWEIAQKFNEHANTSWRGLDGHPELRAKVLGAIGLGRVVRHDFHYRDKRGSDKALTELLSRRYPDIRKDEIKLWCSKNSEAVLLEMCCDYGVQEKDRDPIIEAYRKVVSQ